MPQTPSDEDDEQIGQALRLDGLPRRLSFGKRGTAAIRARRKALMRLESSSEYVMKSLRGGHFPLPTRCGKGREPGTCYGLPVARRRRSRQHQSRQPGR